MNEDFEKAKEDIDFVQSARAAVMLQEARGGSIIIWTVFVLFLALFIWMYLSEVDQIVRGEGKVIPASQTQKIQSLEGGIVKKILVKEGDKVKKGQLLAQIDDTRFNASYEENDKKRQALELKVMRLEAETKGVIFQIKNPDKYDPQLVTAEQSLYISRKKNLFQKKLVLKLQLKQTEEDLKSAEVSLEQAKRAVKLLEKELRIKRPLIKQGVISQVELFKLERDYSDKKGEVELAYKKIDKLKAKLKEIDEQIKSADTKFKEEATAELAKARGELSSLKQSIKAVKDQVRRTLLYSPVDGIVQKINVTTLGGVLKAGEVFMEIVPNDSELIVEARIKPRDIAFVHVGLPAVVKFTAYDFSIYGGLEGKVINVSADTFLDKKTQEPYFLIRVKTDKNYLGTVDDPKPILPGMVAQVGVVIGKKRVLEYLLKPVLKAKDVAFTER